MYLDNIIYLNVRLQLERLPVLHELGASVHGEEDVGGAEGDRGPGRVHHEPAVEALVADRPEVVVELGHGREGHLGRDL